MSHYPDLSDQGEATFWRDKAWAAQERANRAEALLHRIMDEGLYEDATHALIEVYFASSPTQGAESE